MKTAVVMLALLVIPAALFFSTGQREAAFEDPARLQRLVAEGKPAYFLVDVRTPAEYASGHIPTALNIPVTDIGDRPPTDNRAALIIVYCRSGVRSSAAKAALERLGYRRVVDFGAVSRWRGELVMRDQP